MLIGIRRHFPTSGLKAGFSIFFVYLAMTASLKWLNTSGFRRNMTREKALIVNVDHEVREELANVLSESYHVLFVKDPSSTLTVICQAIPAVILLDTQLGPLSGLDLCQKIRQDYRSKSIPVIFLTEDKSAETKIRAFECGADDYLTRPYSPQELMARIAGKIRRSHEMASTAPENHLIEFGNLILNLEAKKIEISGRQTDLGHLESRILHCLIKNTGRLVTRSTLNQYIWGDELPSERALDPHINSLRKKIKDSHAQLKTFYGRGYCLLRISQ